MAVSPVPVISVPRGGSAATTIGANPILKIHPSIGIARLGDSNTFFIGPEEPGGPNTGLADGKGSAVPPFRSGGQVKRQAARFRIFLYSSVPGPNPVELNSDNPEVAEIEWTVHLANKKAAFFEFAGQTGAAGPYNVPPPRRNPTITGAARNTKLVIDPGPKKIKGLSAGPTPIDSSTGNFPKNLAGAPVINLLGELHTDAKGRLLVLGGKGVSVSSNALPPSPGQRAELVTRGFAGPPVSPARPQAPLLNYANNDTWFDDIADGPVTATVKLKSGRTIAVQFPAWVLVGPPDFAPEIRNVISLYDAMLDVAIRELPAPPPTFYPGGENLKLVQLKASFGGIPATFQPEYFVDIDPILSAALHAGFVQESVRGFHATPLTKPGLQNPAASAKPEREVVFKALRPPAGNTTYIGPNGSMPALFGDKYFDALDPRRVAALPEVIHHMFKLWKDGDFVVGGPRPTVLQSPDTFDRAALESCSGGAFFPGIECSWLMRDKRIYLEPFRIKHGATLPHGLTVGPGFFSQQMALPWQADFYECRRESSFTGVMYGWWPAQRPDDVFLNAADVPNGVMSSWSRGVDVPPVASTDVAQARAAAFSQEAMVLKWKQLGFVVASGAGASKVFLETERTLP
jgi:hypothetical protein